MRVRRAITRGLDRRLMVQAVFGTYGEVPYGPVSPLLWIRHRSPKPALQNLAESRRLLAAAGWNDSDGDGVLDQNGRPLTLELSLPNTSGIRRQMALLVQEQLRQIGVRLELQSLEFPVWAERHAAGNFDIDFTSTVQDPSPAGLTQAWTCHGGSNVAKWCYQPFEDLVVKDIFLTETA